MTSTFTNFRGVVFTSGKTESVSVAVDAAGNVRVWDDVAKHYTYRHLLTDAQCARLVKKARKESTPCAGARQFHGRM